MKSLAILLTVHNRKKQTLECLQNVYAQLPIEGYSIDIFLTDDGCTDGTSEAVKKLYPMVNIIEGDGNLYWNRGMYKAWEAAAQHDYDYYLWLNDDTIVFDNILNVLLESSYKKNDQSIIVGATRNVEGIMTYGGIQKGFKQVRPNGDLLESYQFNGNIVLIPKYVYLQLGNLDPYYHHDKGDIDYGNRARKAGIKIYQSSCFLGICENHGRLSDWCNPQVPFHKRFKNLYAINGLQPVELFHLNYKNQNLFRALFSFFCCHIRCIIPQLWVITGRAKVYKSLSGKDANNKSLINGH